NISVRQAVRPAASFVVILAAVTFAVATALVFSFGVSPRVVQHCPPEGSEQGAAGSRIIGVQQQQQKDGVGIDDHQLSLLLGGDEGRLSSLPFYTASLVSSTGNWTRLPDSQVEARLDSLRAGYFHCPLLDDQDKCSAARYQAILSWEFTAGVTAYYGKTGDSGGSGSGRSPGGAGVEGTASSDETPSLEKVARECLAGRALAFSGDSLSRQSVHSLVCMLAHAIPGSSVTKSYTKNDVGAMDSFVVSMPRTNSEEVTEQIGNGHGARDTITVLWNTNDLNPYLVSYKKGRPRPELDLEVLHPSLRRMLDERPDWLILNFGLWVDPSSWAIPGRDFLQGFKLIIVNVLRSLSLLPNRPRVIFRNTPFRHQEADSPDSDGYSCNSTEPSFNTSGIDYLYGYAEEAQNAVLSSLLRRENQALLESAKEGPENAGIRSRLLYRILDAESVGRARRDAHKGWPKDCSHYCLPGVPDHWNRLLLQMMWDDCIKGLVP
ncbi:hypothetical protein HK405_011190, partial [Cladochytrium tenue]